MTAAAPLGRVHARYDAMARRLAHLRVAPAADPALCAQAASWLAAEARLLDARAFDAWQEMLSEDMVLWVPVHPEDHPARDQALLFDDRRRIAERIAHFSDRQAWAVTAPDPLIIRHLGTVEAWDTGAELLATAPIEILHVRRGAPLRLSGREVLSLSHDPAAGRGLITSKTLILPELVLSTPHLGWII
ncbi:aromatic-ring-hydroxylating dioxygenase subunit beta [Celeribacter indicus]|uniref:Aromatic hydrocarbon dioxygenase small subunit n=1 Tax=Celeribacter indicus TaxID=1208324 RepID=A0A0B5E0C4_9RHOB|nr:aromatic-ring-hydroxylating dioxygenase subunit beta [Celeribacter indicus]AJE46865.1 aromatic hydrocarbon dioxygenase small subunit [Celeribacter indicus]SDW79945.1 Ring hydroxylating beta subunit [Celeribacter indicus]